jgi:hypothetical protein
MFRVVPCLSLAHASQCRTAQRSPNLETVEASDSGFDVHWKDLILSCNCTATDLTRTDMYSEIEIG